MKPPFERSFAGMWTSIHPDKNDFQGETVGESCRSNSKGGLPKQLGVLSVCMLQLFYLADIFKIISRVLLEHVWVVLRNCIMTS